MRMTVKIAFLAIALVGWGAGYLRAQTKPNSASSPLTAQEVAARMEEKGRERALALRTLDASRVYRLEYWGFGGKKQAEMQVRMSFRAPDAKSLTVISQSGSSFIIEHVFSKLLEGEQEALDNQNRQATALTAENYDFSLDSYQQQPDGAYAYVLNVKPRSRNKFLYEGKIWVNADDYAVTRIEAAPVRSPSFWIKKTQVEHTYTKVGKFWLPAQNRSESQIRLGGRAVLTIDYSNYQVNLAPPGASQVATLFDNAPQTKKRQAKNSAHRQFGASDAALADALNIPK